MLKKFVRDFTHTAKQDIHIFFLPFKGALDGIKQELSIPLTNWTVGAIALKSLRLLFSPFIGITRAYRTELSLASENN